jgi:hypothetical protein
MKSNYKRGIIIVCLLFILAVMTFFPKKEGFYAPAPAPAAATNATNAKYDPSNYNIQYHESATDIKASNTDVINGVAAAPTSATYYDAKQMKYAPVNYVPNYEDTVYFSKLTGLGYQTPITNANYQLSGFCKYDRFFPEKIEQKCNALNVDTCATTSCCVLLGNNKCVAGDSNGPKLKSHYTDSDVTIKDKYFYLGRCYGNCIDDQTNYSDVGNATYIQSIPAFSQNNPSFLPSVSDYLTQIMGVSGRRACSIDKLGNLVNKDNVILANNAKIDNNGNFTDANGNVILCPSPLSSPASSPTQPVMNPSPSAQPVPSPVPIPLLYSPSATPATS